MIILESTKKVNLAIEDINEGFSYEAAASRRCVSITSIKKRQAYNESEKGLDSQQAKYDY